jgi:hypothetical protein
MLFENETEKVISQGICNESIGISRMVVDVKAVNIVDCHSCWEQVTSTSIKALLYTDMENKYCLVYWLCRNMILMYYNTN